MRRSIIRGVGSYLPAKVLTNQDLSKMVDTDDAWIVERTGISERRIAAKGELTSDLALAASRNALADAGMEPEAVDLIVLATATPDQTFPATAVTVQAKLGITGGAAFDVQAVCSGFVYALATADNFIKAGQARSALVIGAETFSRIIDWTDRGTCVLFGDGAGAFVLEAGTGTGTTNDQGILSTQIRSDGRYRDKLYVDGGPSSSGTSGHVKMEGREVFRHAVVNIASIIEETLKDQGIAAKDIDWFVPHQANRRILEGTAKKLGLREDSIVMTLDRHGNTSAASIPLAFDAAKQDGRIKRGDLVLMEAMGGGFTWGATLARY
ncbi:MAG TPA: beta-ketoacyl-ACP synthase III [Aestuariivirgaceae bacterium]|nr:beta-ketoacyl-ACP synthase III [Aestuariivirgaceae bacterium]